MKEKKAATAERKEVDLKKPQIYAIQYKWNRVTWFAVEYKTNADCLETVD